MRAIVASDGGQTVFGYLDLIDVEAIRADPKPILGYSDISLLHLALHARTGLVGFHPDMAVPGFGGHWQSAPTARQASPTLPEIVLDVLGDRDIPVLGNVESGHAGPNLPCRSASAPASTRSGGRCRCSNRRWRQTC
ncbi:LD-carboxypeptidase [Kitasatospora purpeofusca]|uniref:LD-carboxypeptidase n=1 Tax=Kitasatospora purpeofusca TaxID=67352 RepID=A0ABZ1TRJ8_9ACTN|nr:LD-carboxypeptidase [Kitasatospora purpeofusca]